MKRAMIGLILVLFPSLVVRSSVPVRAEGQGTYTVMAAGDIACDPASPSFHGGQGDKLRCQEKATSDLLLAGHPDAVLPLGDNQYERARFTDFLQSYDPTWGRVKAITHPVAGNHEYGTDAAPTPNAAGYFAYFGSLAGPAPGGYYSYDLGSWHFIALNSNCAQIGGCSAGSPQEQWLLSDLAAHRSSCTVAYWHFPRFTSGTNLNHPEMGAFWDDLYAFGADIVLNGHDHDYERFAPQTPGQQPDPARGIREIIVGTGGRSHATWLAIQPNSELRDAGTFGILRLTLRADSYDWQFLPENQAGNGNFTDKGSGTCHPIGGSGQSGSSPRAVPVVTGSGSVGLVGRFTVDFTSSEPGQAKVLFGPGPGCAGLVMTATGDQGAGTTHHVFVVSGNDLPGTVGDNGITPGATYSYETVTMTGSGTEVDNNAGKCYTVTIPNA